MYAHCRRRETIRHGEGRRSRGGRRELKSSEERTFIVSPLEQPNNTDGQIISFLRQHKNHLLSLLSPDHPLRMSDSSSSTSENEVRSAEPSTTRAAAVEYPRSRHELSSSSHDSNKSSTRSSSRSVSRERSNSCSSRGRRVSTARSLEDRRTRLRSRSPLTPSRRSHSRSHSRQSRRSASRSRSYSRSRSPRSRSSSRDRQHATVRRLSRSHVGGAITFQTASYRSRHHRVPEDERANPPPSTCVGVFGMPNYITEPEVEDMFKDFGTILNLTLIMNRNTGLSRGYAFIYYEHVGEAREARRLMNGAVIDGMRIRVDYSAMNHHVRRWQMAHSDRPT